VKVRLQNQTQGTEAYKSMTDCIRNLIKNEGPLAFYKGVLPPLLAVGACTSIQFGVLESTKRFLLSLQSNKKNGLDMKFVFVSGAVAGLANAIVSVPAEHLRIRMQIQNNERGTLAEYKNSIDASKHIYKKYGIKGIYKGGWISTIKEMYSYGIYFGTYELALRSFLTGAKNRNDLGPVQVILAGSLAGYVVWFLEYPIDLVKTRIQADSFVQPKFKSSVHCAIQTYQSGGVIGFYRGLLPCMLRAGPVNAGSFLAYEYSLKYFTKRNE